jgi:endo-1,4-beta-xylanase
MKTHKTIVVDSTVASRVVSPLRRALLGNLAFCAGGLALAPPLALAGAQPATGLARAFRKSFRIGVAVSNQALDQQIAGQLDLIAREFNSVTAENAMKWGVIRPDGINWQWERADRLVDFAGKHSMEVLGHTLVWHSQVPAGIFVDAGGRPLTRDALLAKMQQHIETLVGRYKGRVWAWDVVNEAVDEGNGWRHSQWHDIIGDDFMERAFRFAHAADPKAQLLYNDYNMHNPQKRAFLVDVLKDYLARGVPINGVGMQSHVGLTYPDLEEWERSIATYAGMGLKVHITELDVDVLPIPASTGADVANRAVYSREIDPWREGFPDEMQEKLADRYEALFRILLRHRKSVERVTFWGLHDGISWKNDFPVRGRTNYPLLFDRAMQPKPAYFRLMKLAQKKP